MKNSTSISRNTPHDIFHVSNKVESYVLLEPRELKLDLWLSVWNQEVVSFRCFPCCSIKPERYLNLVEKLESTN